jgi:insulysin
MDISIDHQDSVFVAAYQGGSTDIGEQARYKLLGELVKTPFFTELRTNQQLGYVVSAYYSRVDRVPGLRVVIQSSTHGPAVLQERIDAFLQEGPARLAEMDETGFETVKEGLIAKLEEKDTSLYNRTGRFQGDLSLGYIAFDHRRQLVVALKEITKDEMDAFYTEHLLGGKSSRLLVRSTGQAHPEEAPGPGCADAACMLQDMEGSFTR